MPARIFGSWICSPYCQAATTSSPPERSVASASAKLSLRIRCASSTLSADPHPLRLGQLLLALQRAVERCSG